MDYIQKPKPKDHYQNTGNISACIHHNLQLSFNSRIRKITMTHAKTDAEEKKLLNKVFIFVFFVHKKYSRSFIKLQLNHWCHMDYFNDVYLLPFWAFTVVVALLSMQGQKALGFQQKIS